MELKISSFTEILSGNDTNAFSWDVCGKNITYMALETFFFFILLLSVENGQIRKLFNKLWIRIQKVANVGHKTYDFNDNLTDVEKASYIVDEDVAEEQRRIEQLSVEDKGILIIKNLRKVFAGADTQNPVIAVRELSLGVSEGECFGFLGVRNQMKKVRQVIGYCPQFDPLINLMTAREHLTFFAKLRGVPAEKVDEMVEVLLQKSGLEKFADEVSGSYSGGNKRKLSFCIALIGNPAVVFLDEPSSGMDPVSRRFMWNIINASKMGRSIVLTTHSMEECEALCGRVGIMASGALLCLGSIQHLKSKFGRGYQVDVKLKVNEEEEKYALYAKERNEIVKKIFFQNFSGLSIEEEFPLMLKMQLPVEGHSLASIFKLIEDHRKTLGIEDYAISQSSLEQVFISIAKKQSSNSSA